MQFFRDTVKSIFNPLYYQQLQEKPLSYSLKYFLKLSLLLAFIISVVLTVQFIPMVGIFINETNSKLPKIFPVDLMITLKGGTVSTNAQEPVLFRIPPEDQKIPTNNTQELENFIVIDTVTPFSIEKMYAYKTAAWITRDSVVITQEGKGKTEIQSLKKFPDFTISYATIAQLLPYIKFLIPLAFIGLFIVFTLIMLSSLVYMVLGALLVMLAAKARKISLTYKKAYQIGVHAMTPAVIIVKTLPWIFPGITWSFTLFFTLLTLLIVVINLNAKNS